MVYSCAGESETADSATYPLIHGVAEHVMNSLKKVQI